MSVVAGIWQLDGAPDPVFRVRRMLAALSMYASAPGREWAGGPVALGVRPRAILPEDVFDTQPLSSPDNRFRLVADVRLDNREELATRLSLPRASLPSVADAALLFAAWLRWQERCLDYLVGEFSFAVWDGRERRLVLARDPTSGRPLYYHYRPGVRFAFASMPKGLLGLPELRPELDEDQIACQLALVPTDRGRLLFRGIERVPPAHWVSVTDKGLQVSRYWSPAECPEIHFRTDQEYLDAFRERMDVAVRSQVRGIGGVGSHLSAGLDSSSITATAARILASGPSGLTAFTAVPVPEARLPGSGRMSDEGPAAAQVAALFPNVTHVLVDSASSTLLDAMDPFIAAADHPPNNPSNNVWLAAIMREAQARGLLVMLTGASGNVTISQAGLSALSDWFRGGRWLQLSHAAWSMCSQRDTSVLGFAWATLGPNLPRWVGRRLKRGRLAPYPGLVHPQALSRLNLVERFRDRQDLPEGDARAGAHRMFGLIDRGPHIMAGLAMYGVEERDPTADRRVVEFCFGIPAEQFIRGGQARSLVRRAMQDRLPQATLVRRTRGLQSADWHLRMGRIRDRMVTELDLLEQSPIARRCLDLPRARSLVQQWPQTEFPSSQVTAAWHHALARGLAMGRFIRHYDPDAPRP